MKKLVSVEEMRQADMRAIESGLSAKELTLRAARALRDAYHWQGKTAIVCGVGNNGGDGYALACLLKEMGREVTVFSVGAPKSPEAVFYAESAAALGVEFGVCAGGQDLSAYDTVVDCLLGMGGRGVPKGPILEAVRAINRSGAYVVSCDLNTGLGGVSGLAEGEFVLSDLTVAIGAEKYGHVLGQAKDAMKSVVTADIGIETESNVFLFEKEDAAKLFPPRRQYSHKGSFGKVGILGGCMRYSGAVKLSHMASCALRVGAGIASLIIPNSIVQATLPYVLETVITPFPEKDGYLKYDEEGLNEVLKEYTALAVGMGMGNTEEGKKIIEYLLKNAKIPLILDADGLNLLQGQSHLLKETEAKVTLTPHPAEFSRLSGISVGEILQNPIRHAMDFAKEYGVTLLLKGTASVVTDGDIAYVVDRGNVGQATAGSGDVLSGILVGIQGYSRETPLLIAADGAYIAGLSGEYAAEAVGEYSMTARDTVSMISKAIAHVLS